MDDHIYIYTNDDILIIDTVVTYCIIQQVLHTKYYILQVYYICVLLHKQSLGITQSPLSHLVSIGNFI